MKNSESTRNRFLLFNNYLLANQINIQINFFLFNLLCNSITKWHKHQTYPKFTLLLPLVPSLFFSSNNTASS